MNKILKINKVVKCIVLCSLLYSNSIYAQEDIGGSIGFGVSKWNLSNTQVDIFEDSYQGVYLSGDIDISNFIWSFDLNIPLTDDDIEYFNFGLGAGFILFNGNRLTLPLNIIGGAWSIEKKSEKEHSGFFLGVKPGIRFYISNKLALNSNLKLARNFFQSFVGDKPEAFDTSILELGITYSFISQID